MNKPIFLIGAARSGTTFLGDILGHHNDVAYWIEPKYIWNYSKRDSDNDLRSSNEASENVKIYIRNKFGRFTERKSKSRFMEKTPSNCFRIPFIYEIFPEGKFLNIIRDGRDVAFSAKKKWTSKPDRSAFIRRIKKMEIPLRDLPYYGKEIIRDVIGRELMPDKAFVWGPKFQGMDEVIKKLDLLEVCAIQWQESVEKSLHDLSLLPTSQVYTVKFESIITNPEEELKSILDFLELKVDNGLINYALDIINKDAKKRWLEKDSKDLQRIEKHISDLLINLGYNLQSNNMPIQ